MNNESDSILILQGYEEIQVFFSLIHSFIHSFIHFLFNNLVERQLGRMHELVQADESVEVCGS